MSLPSRNTILQALVALALGVAMYFLALFFWTATAPTRYAGRIFPGVSVAGIDLSGKTPADAALLLSQTLTYPYTGKVVFRDGAQVWVASPAELGMVFDAAATAESAFRVGRSGGIFSRLKSQWLARHQGVNLPPVIILDERVAYRYLQSLASEMDTPTVEASLDIQGTDVIAREGQIGRALNVDLTLVSLGARLRSFQDGEVALVVEETPPVLMDVSEQAEEARAILDAPLRLTLPDAEPDEQSEWVFDAPALAKMLLVTRVQREDGAELHVSLDETALAVALSDIAEEVNRAPVNARFVFDEETHQLDLLESAVIGRTVDVPATVANINEEITRGIHDIPLEMTYQEPEVPDTATAGELGIRELVVEQTSYFYGSSVARIQNIQAAAARFHGLLVAPGEVFSMGEALGDVSLDTGYAEALIIYGGRTIKGVGGGVCQVSTTLFRTVFFGGYPVIERHSHAYRVRYYELTASGAVDESLAGMDATVYFPLVDFKFQNDTPYWILMETYVDVAARKLTWKFYSTSDGRSVDWHTSGLQNVVPPPEPLFQESEELGKDEIRQVDWAVEGADVVITRIVWRNGTILYQDEFKTHYEPWQAVCEFGHGTKDPEKLAKKKNLCH